MPSDSDSEPEAKRQKRTHTDIDAENHRKNVYYETPADYIQYVKPEDGNWPIDEVSP
jgi:hypothetical protein